ncbi:DUF6376 family protein [Shouchella patagoniensis]|uniref:DUF6376 family protein n=1 Tax=Shouchella patagoniensis TaxID=228576 RepID=UPI000994F5ED|nr:DUF6376 family protein [Shouchella patagoniensis]
MKKTVIALLFPFVLITTGCSALDEISNGLDYVPAATDYVTDVQQFASDIPTLAETAITDKEARVQLEESLTTMKTNIDTFNELTPPELLEDVHNEALAYNESFEQGIDMYLSGMEDGEFNTELLNESGILDNVEKYTNLLDDFNQLIE